MVVAAPRAAEADSAAAPGDHVTVQYTPMVVAAPRAAEADSAAAPGDRRNLCGTEVDVDDPRERLTAELTRAETRLEHLEREHADIVQIVQLDVPDDEHDPDGATLAWERQQLAALIEGERRRITAITDALTRLDQGTYGACVDCGELIAPGRLDVRPFATRCIACAR